MSESRFFTIIGSDIGFEGGRYKADKSGSPGSAAKRAAKILFRMVENTKNDPKFKKYAKFANHKAIKFIVRETTKGSDKNSYYYEATSVPLKKPVTLTLNGVEVTYTRKIEVKKHISTPHQSHHA